MMSSLFNRYRKPLLGMIHLPALPGEPMNQLSFNEILHIALEQADILNSAGFDGLILENFGDVPFHPHRVFPHTIAAMAIISHRIRTQHPHLLIGINILRNAALAALGVAHISTAHVIRVNIHTGAAVTDQGIITGQAYRTIRYRHLLQSNVAIWADINVKHSAPLASRPLATVAQETILRGKADALILTGEATGSAPDPETFHHLRTHLPNTPLILGSGATPELLPTIYPLIDGCIVGSYIKYEGNPEHPIDPQRATHFAEVYRGLSKNS